MPAEIASKRRVDARAASRAQYGAPRDSIEAELKANRVALDSEPVRTQRRKESPAGASPRQSNSPDGSSEQADIVSPLPGRGGPQHKKLQSLIRKLAEDRGYTVNTEVPVLGGHGHVDVTLEKDGRRIAIEISVSARLEHEVGNLTKCLGAGFDIAVLVSSDTRLLDAAKPELANAEGRVAFLTPHAVAEYLDRLDQPRRPAAGRRERPRAQAVTDTKPRLSSDEAAAFIGVATQTLAKMRWTGESPPYAKIGRKVVYSRDELESWLKERRRRSTSDSGDEE